MYITKKNEFITFILVLLLKRNCTPQQTQNKNRHTQPSRWWLSGKNLGSRGLLPLWSQVRAIWLLRWWPLETYMVVNFRACKINWGVRKLTRTPMLNKKKKKHTLSTACTFFVMLIFFIFLKSRNNLFWSPIKQSVRSNNETEPAWPRSRKQVRVEQPFYLKKQAIFLSG